MTCFKNFLLLLLTLSATDLKSQTLTLLKDIKPGSASSFPSDLVVGNDKLWFTATNTANGAELWKSNGNSNSTEIAFDLNPGTASSFPSRLLFFNNELYFVANDGINGNELWKTNGTLSGSVKLTASPVSSPVFAGGKLAAYNGKVYFPFDDGIHGSELWSTDGTTAGTHMVKDIGANSISTSPTDFFIFNNLLYFTGEAPIDTRALYVTDGSEAGTQMVFNCNEGGCSGFTTFNNALFFISDDAVFSQPNLELYKSDGTPAGTQLFKEINPNSSGALRDLVVSGNKMYFVGDDGINGDELWKSDGTVAGTVMVKDIRPGSQGSVVTEITPFKNKVVFEAYSKNGFGSFWISDGSAANTFMLDTIIPDLDQAAIKSIIHKGKLFFNGFKAGKGYEVCVTDGTIAGTDTAFDINQGIATSAPVFFVKKKSKLYFSATDDQSGNEVFVISDVTLQPVRNTEKPPVIVPVN
ncbi:MAG TPA: hypothetical protein PLD84_01720 [Chitinophagales bacterium]|nr:hypothetical protein [Chitinophagales bacterium]